MSVYVLDACALIALLREEQGASIVADILYEANTSDVFIYMHRVNLLEVYYDIYRSVGKETAACTLSDIKKLPITFISNIDDAMFEEAARLKVCYKISLADTLALATAFVMKGVLITSDHHEMDRIEQSEPKFRFRWIR